MVCRKCLCIPISRHSDSSCQYANGQAHCQEHPLVSLKKAKKAPKKKILSRGVVSHRSRVGVVVVRESAKAQPLNSPHEYFSTTCTLYPPLRSISTENCETNLLLPSVTTYTHPALIPKDSQAWAFTPRLLILYLKPKASDAILQDRTCVSDGPSRRSWTQRA